ncbi:hypothetical protein A5871_003362 [Enterococcus sp. 2F9_DIV0599]|nr:hypothetical protein A5871_003362 [Enterococcus sp. 2F9_DIV0599]
MTGKELKAMRLKTGLSQRERFFFSLSSTALL